MPLIRNFDDNNNNNNNNKVVNFISNNYWP